MKHYLMPGLTWSRCAAVVMLLLVAGCSRPATPAPATALPASQAAPPAAAPASPLPATAAPVAQASPAAATPPAEVADTAVRYFRLIDAGDFAGAYPLAAQVKWNEVGLHSYQSGGLMSQAEFVDFLEQNAGVGGQNFTISSIGVVQVQRLPVASLALADYPELYTLAALPGKVQPVALYELQVGGTMIAFDSCAPREFARRAIVAELPGAERWKVLLPGNPPGTLVLDPGQYLNEHNPFEGATLLG